MHKKRLLLVGVLLLAGVGSWQVLRAQNTKRVEAEALLPTDTAIYLKLAGYKNVQDSFAKTAASQSLSDSGFLEMLLPLVEKGLTFATTQANAPPEAKLTLQTIRKLVEHVMDHGMTLGIDVRITLGEAILVLPEAAQVGLAKEIDERVRHFAALGDYKIEEQRFEGRKIATMRVPPALISWWSEGPDLVLLVNMLGPKPVVERAAGKADGLNKSEVIKKFKGQASYAVAGEFWADGEALLKLLPRFTPIPEALELTGFGGFKGLKVRWGFDGSSLRSDTDFLVASPRTGLLKLIDQPAIDIEKLPKIPADVDSIAAFSLDGGVVFDTVHGMTRKAIETFAPQELEQFEKGQKQLEEDLGFKLRDELAATLGSSAVIYQSPLDGPLGIGGLSLVVGVKDRDRLAATLDKVAERIKREDKKALIDKKKVDDADLWIGGYQEQGFPLAPTFALTDRWLVVGIISPASVMRFIRLQEGAGEAWTPPERLLGELKGAKNIRAFTYTDPRPMAKTLATVIPILAGMARNSLPMLEIDLTKLPDLEQMIAPLFPGTGITRVDETGVHSVSYSSLPIAGPGIGGGVTVAPVLVALLLPAVQQARVAARRAQDANNQKQIALGLHNYHDTYKAFPRGTAKEAQKLKVDQRLSWQASILPFMEQSAAYQELRFAEAWDSENNKKITDVAMPVYRNPNIPTPGKQNVTNYVGMAGVGADAAMLKGDNQKAGIFGYERETALRDISDGSSNTIMTMEVNKDVGPWAQGGKSTIRGLSKKPYIGGPDGFGGFNDGLNVGLADGSVRFIPKNIDPKVLEALSTKSGGEVVPNF